MAAMTSLIHYKSAHQSAFPMTPRLVDNNLVRLTPEGPLFHSHILETNHMTITISNESASAFARGYAHAENGLLI